MALAKFHLTTGNRPVADVARMAGFTSTTHLGLVMRRYEGQIPLEYRQSHASVAE